MKNDNLTAPEAWQAALEGKKIRSHCGDLRNVPINNLTLTEFKNFEPFYISFIEKTESQKIETELLVGHPFWNKIFDWVRLYVKEEISKLKSELS